MKSRIVIAGCIFMVIVSTLSFAQNAGKNVVSFVGDPWTPWVYGAEGSPPEKGIAVDIIMEIFKRLNGFTADLKLLPWSRCLTMVKEGESDALILCAYNAERAAYAVFTDEIVRNKAVFIYRKGEMPKWESLKDLGKYPMGILAGNDYGMIFDKAAKDFAYNVNDVSKSADQALVMLKSGRFDIFLTTDACAAEVLKSNPKNKNDFEAMVSPFSDGDIYFIAFSKKSPYVNLIPRINKIIAQIKAEGVIDNIRSKYLYK
jgi:polar amino acid transport system substrate-binding protein